jgi:hypothetical protein
MLGRDASPTAVSYMLVHSFHDYSKENPTHRSTTTVSVTALSTAPLFIMPPLCRPASPSRPSAAAGLPPSPLHLLPATDFCSARACRGLLHQACCGLFHRSGKVRATNKLCIGELHAPASLHSQEAKKHEDVALKEHVASLCFKCFIGIVAKYFIWILQAFVSNVLSVFLYVRYKCVYLDVAYVSHICYKFFIWMLRMFYNGFKFF